jgi:hypothetical protein
MVSGGAEGTGAAFPGSRVREAGPPVPSLHHRRSLSLIVGIDRTMIEAGDDKRPQEQPEGAARGDRVDLRRRRAPRAPAKCGGGFSLAVSPVM